MKDKIGDIRDLPKSTLISIVRNIKENLSIGKELTKLNITKEPNETNSYITEYFWNDAKGGISE